MAGLIFWWGVLVRVVKSDRVARQNLKYDEISYCTGQCSKQANSKKVPGIVRYQHKYLRLAKASGNVDSSFALHRCSRLIREPGLVSSFPETFAMRD